MIGGVVARTGHGETDGEPDLPAQGDLADAAAGIVHEKPGVWHIGSGDPLVLWHRAQPTLVSSAGAQADRSFLRTLSHKGVLSGGFKRLAGCLRTSLTVVVSRVFWGLPASVWSG